MNQIIHNTLDWIINKIIILFFVILLCFSAYSLYDTYHIRYISSDDSFKAFKPNIEQPEAYKEISDECVGWITLNDTTIDYPIMQTTNNSKYLNTNPYGEYSLAGSIFLDWQNSPDFSDKYSLLYGHKMSDGLMFGALTKWEDKEFYNSHLDGTLTVNETVYNIKVFSLVITDAREKTFFSPVGYTNQLETIKANNVYFTEIPDDSQIVALSTCRDPGTTLRTILFVYIIK